MGRIGIYGGTFNPPHLGHIQAARMAVKTLNLDKLLMIPDYIAPHKALPENSPTPWQRLEMLRLAVEQDSAIVVSDVELQREGPSYTCETVELLRRQYPQDQLILLMGTDMFLSFDTWKEPERIVRNAELAVAYRGDRGEQQAVRQRQAALQEQGAAVHLLENPVLEISSTQLRRLLAFQCADSFLCSQVAAYIREKGLYDTAANWKNLPMEQLEQVVIGLLKPSRVAHVLGCRDTAVELARRWGADEVDAARAGILHDITKALDGPLQLTLCSCYGKILSDFSQKYPKTLHALTGSLVAQRIFGENPAVVDAIAWHTTGKADMNLLETIVYVADYMEPNRTFPGVERLRQAAFQDIQGALEMGLEMPMEHLRRQGNEVSPESQQALNWLRQIKC